jgi:hypothetical protein
VRVETRALELSWVKTPDVQMDAPGQPIFSDSGRAILSPVVVECDVASPPTREELRSVCDREKTPAAIRSALEGPRTAS